MIQYKELSLSDKNIISSYTLHSTEMNCDFSFSNLFTWRFIYNTCYAIVHDFLVLKFWDGDRIIYIFPIGKGEITPVLDKMFADAAEEKQPLRFYGLSETKKEELERLCPGKFIFKLSRDRADYIYLRTDLVELTGKKYQPKRNHINKFKIEHPDWTYTPITPGEIEDCLEMERRWCITNRCHEQEGLGNERRSLIAGLHHFEELGLMGGMLHANGEIVAFTFGMPINATTFGVHVEKADSEVQGAYAVINQEFANRIPEQYMYVNREEDLGIEGLRKAKLSYKPTIILDKYQASVKE